MEFCKVQPKEMEMSELYQLGRRLTELAYEGMGAGELEISPSEFLVLRDLYMNGESSIRETVERTGLAQSRVSTSVANLRQRGWVETGADPDDGRKTLARVTKQVKLEGDRRRGQSAAGALDRVLANAKPSERNQLASALERLHELLVEPHKAEQVRVLASEKR
jgi:MarR family 2-MHQ and catechol resistance regulon transcriptional repressor